MSSVIHLRRNLPLEEMDLAGAFSLMFPGFKGDAGMPPVRSWRAGSRPSLESSDDQNENLRLLDDIISALAHARDARNCNSIKLLPINVLSARGIACPYYYVRLGIAYAVNQSSIAEKEYIYSRMIKSKEQEELYGLATKALERIYPILERYTPYQIALLTAKTGKFGHHLHPNSFYEETTSTQHAYANISKSASALSSIVNSVVREREQYVKTNRPEVWISSFITAIGQLWTELTGEVPKAKGKFSEFLAKSHSAIGGIPKKHWFRRIDTSLSATPLEIYSDKGYSVVPPKALLLGEIFSKNTIKTIHAEAIRKAAEGEDDTPEVTINALRQTGELTVEVEALLDRNPWSVDDWVAAELGIPLDVVRETTERLRENEIRLTGIDLENASLSEIEEAIGDHK